MYRYVLTKIVLILYKLSENRCMFRQQVPYPCLYRSYAYTVCCLCEPILGVRPNLFGDIFIQIFILVRMYTRFVVLLRL